MELRSLVEKVKQKRELQGLADEIVLDTIEEYLAKNRINKDEVGYLKKSGLKGIISSTRALLRQFSGGFQSGKDIRERMGMLQENKIQEILKTHSSTRERLEFYPKIKSIIKKLKIHSVLDIGCGINPLALASSSLLYYATDINKDDLYLISEYFKKNRIRGSVFFFNLRRIKQGDLPSADLCLIFKVFDILEKNGHKLAENIINKINCKYFLISFPTKTLSGMPMSHPQRGWIERLLHRVGFSFSTLSSRNEIFYLAEKNPDSGRD